MKWDIKCRKKTPIEACLSLDGVKVKATLKGIAVATKITNKCPQMINYFTKAQIQDEEGFPLLRERQGSHTQIPANQTKTDLLMVRKRDMIDLVSKGSIYVQLISHDHHAHGSIAIKQNIDMTFDDVTKAVETGIQKCLKDMDVIAKVIEDRATQGRSRLAQQQPLFRLSYIAKATNTCQKKFV